MLHSTTTLSQLRFGEKFAENLAKLPERPDLAALRLSNARGEVVATIQNQAGQAGSLRVYAWLAQQFGSITPAAAQLALQMYAEHTLDAQRHPGKHPNIDRLLALTQPHHSLTVIACPASD